MTQPKLIILSVAAVCLAALTLVPAQIIQPGISPGTEPGSSTGNLPSNDPLGPGYSAPGATPFIVETPTPTPTP